MSLWSKDFSFKENKTIFSLKILDSISPISIERNIIDVNEP